jgi:hypothetical protein
MNLMPRTQKKSFPVPTSAVCRLTLNGLRGPAGSIHGKPRNHQGGPGRPGSGPAVVIHRKATVATTGAAAWQGLQRGATGGKIG